MKQQQRPKNQKVDRIKLHKDLGFLLQKQPILINSTTMKYIIEDGKDEVISELTENPFDAVFSYIKYDYEGKILDKIANAKVTSDKAEMLRDPILSMRVKEKAWFNISDQIIHSTIEFIENGVITEDSQLGEEQKQLQGMNRTGLHYQVYLDRIEYRNCDKMEIKRKLYEQNRQKGKILFQGKKFFQAAKVYRFIINISENVSRSSPYSPEDRSELENMNLQAKLNYIRCYFKIEEDWVQKDLADFAKQVLDSLLQKKSNDNTTHYYHAKWLLKERVLDSALQAAQKSKKLKGDPATEELIKEIMYEKKNKGKVKVPVKST